MIDALKHKSANLNDDADSVAKARNKLYDFLKLNDI